MIVLAGFTQIETEEGVRLAKDIVGNMSIKIKSTNGRLATIRNSREVTVNESILLSVDDRKVEACKDSAIQVNGIFGPVFTSISNLDPNMDKPLLVNTNTGETMVRNITYSAELEYKEGTSMYEFITDAPILLSNGLVIA